MFALCVHVRVQVCQCTVRPSLPSQDLEEVTRHTKFGTFPSPEDVPQQRQEGKAQEVAAVAVKAAKDVAAEKAAKTANAAQAESKQKTKNKSAPSKAERADLSKSVKAEAAVQI